MPRVQTHLTIPVPLLLSPDAPKDYGTGRKCDCGTRINRYAEIRKCDRCRRNESDAKFEKDMKEAEAKRNAPHARGVKLPNLKRLRTQRGLTQKQLAEATGVANVFVSYLENKTHGASPKVRTNLARVLGVEVEDLVA